VETVHYLTRGAMLRSNHVKLLCGPLASAKTLFCHLTLVLCCCDKIWKSSVPSIISVD
jgi:hypothetical protein